MLCHFEAVRRVGKGEEAVTLSICKSKARAGRRWGSVHFMSSVLCTIEDMRRVGAGGEFVILCIPT